MIANSRTAEELFQQVCQHVRQTAVWTTVEAALGWDERTMLPPAAGPYRAEQLTAVSALIHRRWTDPQFVGQRGGIGRRALGEGRVERRRDDPPRQAPRGPEDEAAAAAGRRNRPHGGPRAAGLGAGAKGKRLSRVSPAAGKDGRLEARGGAGGRICRTAVRRLAGRL